MERSLARTFPTQDRLHGLRTTEVNPNCDPDRPSRIWVAARAAIPVAAGLAVSTSAQVQRGSQGVVVSMALVSQIAGTLTAARTRQVIRVDATRLTPFPT